MYQAQRLDLSKEPNKLGDKTENKRGKVSKLIIVTEYPSIN
jgi:hypothetical protein